MIFSLAGKSNAYLFDAHIPQLTFDGHVGCALPLHVVSVVRINAHFAIFYQVPWARLLQDSVTVSIVQRLGHYRSGGLTQLRVPHRDSMCPLKGKEGVTNPP